MENKHSLENYTSNFFVVRTPLLPLADFTNLNSKIKGELELEQVSREFKEIFSDKTLQESIYVASPSLFYELTKFLKSNKPLSLDERLITTLYSYYSRMCGRSTPFGLFAGFSFGDIISGVSNISIGSKSTVRRYCRLDMDYLCQLSMQTIKNKPKSKFIYTANSTYYEIGGKLRYIETVILGRNRRYNIAQVDLSPLLRKVLKFSNDKSYSQLLSYVKSQGVPYRTAIVYLNSLIDSQLLVNTLHAHVTGEDYMKTLNVAFHNLKFLREAKILDKINDRLTNLNGANAMESYYSIKNALKRLSPDLDESKLFQLDLMKAPKNMSLDHRIISDVKSSLHVIAMLNPKARSKTRLDLFKEKFSERYETESIKLTDVLDAEIGIDYLELGAGLVNQNNPANPHISSFKLAKYVESMRNGGAPIQLNELDIKAFSVTSILPNSFAAMIRLLGLDNEDISLEVKFANGPSAANLLGRFCPAEDKLNKAVKNILKQEEELDPDKLYAEIAHIPQARLGNVLARPHLRGYEIPFLAQSKIAKAKTIPIQDLYLRMVNNRLILYSGKHKKQVVPRLSTAHNFSNNNLHIYHFLCDLQFDQLQTGLSWNWDLLSGSEFLPRVLFKKCVLSPAQWNISGTKLDFFKNEGVEGLRTKFRKLKKELNLPDLVYLIESDNELLLDLNVSLSLQLIKKHYLKHNTIQFKENLFSVNELPVKDENQLGYANEVIIPFTKIKEALAHRPKAHFDLPSKTLHRNFDLGSEWLYFKLYTGITTADMILRDYIIPFTEELLEKKIIDKWFFIRYHDPNFHFRLRFHLIKKGKLGQVVQSFSKYIDPLLKTREINKYILDTYKREIERYGQVTMDYAETIFFINSVTIGKIIDIYHCYKSFGPNDRLHVGIMAIDSFIGSFGLTMAQKINFLTENRNLFAREFKLERDKKLKEQIQVAYRANKVTIESLLQKGYSAEFEKFDRVSEVLSNEQMNIKATSNQIWADGNAGISETLPVLASFVHMYVNRLMPANSRFNEFLIYENLERYYKSFAARHKADVVKNKVKTILNI